MTKVPVPLEISGATGTMVPVYGAGLYMVPVKFLVLDVFCVSKIMMKKIYKAKTPSH